MRHGRMAFDVVADSPVLRIERTGTPDPPHLKAHCLAIVATAQSRGARRLLVDERGMDGWMDAGLGSLVIYRDIVREAQASGFADGFLQIAVLTVPQASSDHDVLATGANGVGLEMAYFHDEVDALAWLGVSP